MPNQDSRTALAILLFLFGVPMGVRTPVTAVKGRCPRPLDDGDLDSARNPTQNRRTGQVLFFGNCGCTRVAQGVSLQVD